MSNFMTDKKKGRLAELSLCHSLIQMGGGVMYRPHTTDAGGHIDVISFRPGYSIPREDYERMADEGNLEPRTVYGDIRMRCIDAKYAASAPNIYKVRAGQGEFFVEWKSGPDELCTPLSDEDALTTHIALIRMEDGNPQGYHSFYLLDVADVRAFYLKYNDGSGKYVKTVPGDFPHAVLIDCKKYEEEYGFLYFWYDKDLKFWRGETFGCWRETEYCYLAPGDCLLYWQRETERQRRQLMDGALPLEEMLMEERETAELYYGDEADPIKAMQKDIADHVPRYDPKYAFIIPKGMP